MSIRTHIPWPNISGSYYKTSGCCGNKSTSYSAFSGLGTRDFTFTRFSQNNSCCNSGLNSYDYSGYYGYNNYYGGGGCCGGGSNWFTKIMQGLTIFSGGISLFKGFADLFSSNNSQLYDVNSGAPDGALAANQNSGDGKVYRDKTVVTVTEEEGADGKKSYKVTKTTTRVESTDGKTDPIVVMSPDNPTGVVLNDKYEVVFDTKKTITKTRNANGSITTTTTTEQVLSGDTKVDINEEIIDNTNQSGSGSGSAGSGGSGSGGL